MLCCYFRNKQNQIYWKRNISFRKSSGLTIVSVLSGLSGTAELTGVAGAAGEAGWAGWSAFAGWSFWSTVSLWSFLAIPTGCASFASSAGISVVAGTAGWALETGISVLAGLAGAAWGRFWSLQNIEVVRSGIDLLLVKRWPNTENYQFGTRNQERKLTACPGFPRGPGCPADPRGHDRHPRSVTVTGGEVPSRPPAPGLPSSPPRPPIPGSPLGPGWPGGHVFCVLHSERMGQLRLRYTIKSVCKNTSQVRSVLRYCGDTVVFIIRTRSVCELKIGDLVNFCVTFVMIRVSTQNISNFVVRNIINRKNRRIQTNGKRHRPDASSWRERHRSVPCQHFCASGARHSAKKLTKLNCFMLKSTFRQTFSQTQGWRRKRLTTVTYVYGISIGGMGLSLAFCPWNRRRNLQYKRRTQDGEMVYRQLFYRYMWNSFTGEKSLFYRDIAVIEFVSIITGIHKSPRQGRVLQVEKYVLQLLYCR